jgi:predicted MFS family arabinose efflux permease
MATAETAVTTADTAAPLYSRGYRAWLLTVLLLTNAMNLADRQGIAAVAQAVKLDLKFTDSQMGLLQGLAFAIFYSLLGLPIARLAERHSRTKIIAGCLTIFSVMVALCGTATSFLRLLLFRIGVATGDAGFGPPSSSLISDHYPQDKRASVMSIMWLGAPIGVVAGAIFAGWMAENHGWRAAFVAIGLPALPVALLAFATLREPPRGTFDAQRTSEGPPPSMGSVLQFLLAKPSFRHVLIGCGIAATSMNAIGQFLGQFLLRTYHLGFAEAGRMLGLVAGAAMASGLLLGGFGVDWAGRFDKRWYVWLPAIGLALATPGFLLGFNQPTIAATVVVLIVAHTVLFVYYTPSLAIAQNMVGPSMRASSAFVIQLVLSLVGIGIGPTLAGILSDVFARRAFTLGDYASSCPGGAPLASEAARLGDSCAQASAQGLKHAMVVVSLLFVWAGLHYVLASRTLKRDLDTHWKEQRS